MLPVLKWRHIRPYAPVLLISSQIESGLVAVSLFFLLPLVVSLIFFAVLALCLSPNLWWMITFFFSLAYVHTGIKKKKVPNRKCVVLCSHPPCTYLLCSFKKSTEEGGKWEDELCATECRSSSCRSKCIWVPLRGYLFKRGSWAADQWTIRDNKEALRAQSSIAAVCFTGSHWLSSPLSPPSPPLSSCSPPAQTPAETHTRGTGQPRHHAT